MNRLLTSALTRSPFRQSSVGGLLFAAGALLAAMGLRSFFGDPAQVPFLGLYPAIVITAFLAGTRPALLLSVMGAAWTYWRGGASVSAIGVFLIFSALLVLVVDALARSSAELREEQTVTQTLLADQRTMFAELQHRVANNLSFVSALLRLSRKQVLKEPASAIEAYDDAIRRLEVIARLHRQLHQPEAVRQPLSQYLRGLCADLLDATGARNIVCLIDADDDIRLDLSKLTALSLLLVELITNSLKHAFDGREAGTIQVDLKSLPTGKLRLTVADDGPGMPREFSAADARGLGTVIIRGLAKQLNGQLRLPEPGEAVAELVFPKG